MKSEFVSPRISDHGGYDDREYDGECGGDLLCAVAGAAGTEAPLGVGVLAETGEGGQDGGVVAGGGGHGEAVLVVALLVLGGQVGQGQVLGGQAAGDHRGVGGHGVGVLHAAVDGHEAIIAL